MSRSENMSRIKSRDTKPELVLRKALWAAGCRYRLYYKITGRPDLVFLKQRLAVFSDGCFWHGCPIHYSAPGTNQDFWKDKLRKNVLRDMATEDALTSDNWKILRIWQHDLKDIDDIVLKIKRIINQPDQPVETYMTSSQTFKVSEATARYGYEPENDSLWWHCACGSRDVRVLSVSGAGSLRPTSGKRPDCAELICRKCRTVWDASLKGEIPNNK
ncbi:MAG: very short patch repair endonuclease [Desulfobacteraceae bacterium]|nr:very short patch repair endonuclease [Desulfobacteraceae bacterium]